MKIIKNRKNICDNFKIKNAACLWGEIGKEHTGAFKLLVLY